MKESTWSIDPAAGELRIRTGVAGRAAKMGHRLTIAMNSWEAKVHWTADKPRSAELTVDVDSLAVISGEGGIKSLAGPEKGVARSNALKSLNAKKFPQIRFVSDDIAKTADGYRLTGSIEIHGTTRAQTVDLTVEDRGDEWALSTQVRITQSDFGVQPYSLFMGSLKVADEVSVEFAATHPK
jgi:polyisoprenoid-binding protein YceI